MFAPRAFAGNPLAVVFDADGLTTEQCQALAFEFHLSETSFISAPTEPGADYRVRIFTPFAELPFAGHPSVGAAHTLVRTGRLPAGTVRQECGVGVLDLVVDDDGADADRRRAVPRRTSAPPTRSPPRSAWAPTTSPGVPAHMAGCGLPFTYLAVRPGRRRPRRPRPRRPRRAGRGGGHLGAVLGPRRRRPPTPASSPATCGGARTRPPARPRSAPGSGWSPPDCCPATGRRPTRPAGREARPSVGAVLHGHRVRRSRDERHRPRRRRADRERAHPGPVSAAARRRRRGSCAVPAAARRRSSRSRSSASRCPAR